MKRFILLSFVFMGWAFYEMSGGADFDGGEIRTARLAAIEAAEAEKKQKAAARAPKPTVVAEAPKVFVDTDPPLRSDVTRVSLNLTTLAAEQRPAQTIAAAAAATQPVTVDTSVVPQNVASVTSSADTPAIIPSLINPNDGITTNAPTPSVVSYDDIRTVSGNRVNVRGGPGTDFGIVTKLVRGDAVKVVEDNGDGWVRLEPLDGGPSGWMADFLLAGG